MSLQVCLQCRFADRESAVCFNINLAVFSILQVRLMYFVRSIIQYPVIICANTSFFSYCTFLYQTTAIGKIVFYGWPSPADYTMTQVSNSLEHSTAQLHSC